MALTITHNKVTAIPDDPAYDVGSNEWNDAHAISGTLGGANGGTGVANNAASTITISGSFGTTFTVTATTSITLPTTGTLATLAGAEELTSKTLNASVGKGTWTASGTWTLPAVTMGGLVTLTSGQIAFPATAVPSADANTLDDYEEGTWTPVITFATPGDLSVVYNTQLGIYIKIGSSVSAHYSILTSTFTHTTAVGNFQINGFPFAAQGWAAAQRGGALAWEGITKANYTDMTQAIDPSATTSTLRASGSAQTNATIAVADVPTGTQKQFRGVCNYLT